MNFEGAIDLGRRVRDERADLRVVAIGQFVSAEEATESTPWAVSVVSATGGRPRVLRCHSELAGLPNPQPTTVARRQPRQNRKQAAAEQTEALF